LRTIVQRKTNAKSQQVALTTSMRH